MPPDQVVVTVDDIERLGVPNLAPLVKGYYEVGADQEQTLSENRIAFLR